jgi:hypothetical protein
VIKPILSELHLFTTDDFVMLICLATLLGGVVEKRAAASPATLRFCAVDARYKSGTRCQTRRVHQGSKSPAFWHPLHQAGALYPRIA